MTESDDKWLDEALKPLNSGPKLVAYTFKTEGEDGVRALYEGKLTARETVTKWSKELRAMRLIRLADLLDSIALTMPPQRALPPVAHAIDIEGEALWQAWLELHPEHAEFEVKRRAERAAWIAARGRG
jgi:hypothetical protein